MEPSKALKRLLGWIQWVILTLLPILHQNHKVSVLKIAKVPLQIRKLQTFKTIFGISCKFLA